MKGWQFNILFFVGVGGAVFLLLGPQLGLEVNANPTALAGIGSILAYILTQKKAITEKAKRKTSPKKNDADDEGVDADSADEPHDNEGTENDE